MYTKRGLIMKFNTHESDERKYWNSGSLWSWYCDEFKNDVIPCETDWYMWTEESELFWVCDLIGMEIMQVHLLCLECGNGLACCTCE